MINPENQNPSISNSRLEFDRLCSLINSLQIQIINPALTYREVFLLQQRIFSLRTQARHASLTLSGPFKIP